MARVLFLKAKLAAAAAAPAPAQARLPGLLCGPAWLPNYAKMTRVVGRNHWRMAATTCYDVLLQLEETQSLGRRTVSTPCGLRTSGHRSGRRRGGRPGSEVDEDVADLSSPNQAPAETPSSTSAGAAEQAEDVATIRRRPKPGPGRGPNSDRNFGSGLPKRRACITMHTSTRRTGSAGTHFSRHATARKFPSEQMHA